MVKVHPFLKNLTCMPREGIVNELLAIEGDLFKECTLEVPQ